jgi:hypothetical protein
MVMSFFSIQSQSINPDDTYKGLHLIKPDDFPPRATHDPPDQDVGDPQNPTHLERGGQINEPGAVVHGALACFKYFRDQWENSQT